MVLCDPTSQNLVPCRLPARILDGGGCHAHLQLRPNCHDQIDLQAGAGLRYLEADPFVSNRRIHGRPDDPFLLGPSVKTL